MNYKREEGGKRGVENSDSVGKETRGARVHYLLLRHQREVRGNLSNPTPSSSSHPKKGKPTGKRNGPRPNENRGRMKFKRIHRPMVLIVPLVPQGSNYNETRGEIPCQELQEDHERDDPSNRHPLRKSSVDPPRSK
jgi:hypothetical protein